MERRLKITLLQAFCLSKPKVSNEDEYSPVIKYEDVGESFQSTTINDARSKGFIEVGFNGFSIKRKFLYLTTSEFQKELGYNSL